MSDRFETYPEMTESGDGLFCEIPASWDRLRIKQLFQIRKDIAGRLGYPVWSVTQHGLREKDITSGEGQLSMDYSKYQMLRVGDLVMNHMDLITGGVDIGWKEGVTSPDYRVFIPRRNAEVNKQFFVWLFRLCYWTKKFYSLGQGSAHLGRWRLPTRAFESIVVPVPPIEEQKQIAAFLDYETAKIDALIAMQQQLIALLGEKRQAVISHAVTKGLTPDAPMRDSGIEWLGEVPEHWTTTTLKFHARVVDCKHITAEFVDDGIPVASIAEAKGWFVDLTTAKFTTEKYYEDLIGGGRKPLAGDIIYTRNATVGEAAIVKEDMPRFAMGQDVCLLRSDGDVDSEFLLHCLKSPVISNQVDLAMVGSTFKRINVDDIRNFAITLPPMNEQTEVVAHLSAKLECYDSLIDAAEDTVTLVKERRTALISAAVTGKIDVRGWKPPSSGAKQETEMEVA